MNTHFDEIFYKSLAENSIPLAPWEDNVYLRSYGDTRIISHVSKGNNSLIVFHANTNNQCWQIIDIDGDCLLPIIESACSLGVDVYSRAGMVCLSNEYWINNLSHLNTRFHNFTTKSLVSVDQIKANTNLMNSDGYWIIKNSNKYPDHYLHENSPSFTPLLWNF